MALSLEVETTGSATTDGKYRVTWTVSTAAEMPAEIFLHTRSTDRFDGVIAASDLVYPTTPEPGSGYYRKSTAQGIYPDIETAERAKINIDTALADLVEAYKSGLVDFLGADTKTYT